MTKSSDRYARWFGTRVPLVSRSFIILITLIGALAFSFATHPMYGLPFLRLNLLTSLFVSLIVGFLVHLFYLFFLRMKFINPSESPEFHEIVGRIHQKVVISERTHIWIRQSRNLYIATTFNPLFNAVIISEPMLDLMLKSPESAEALLAFHLLKVPQTMWIADMVGSIILFTIISYLSNITLVPMVASLIRYPIGYIMVVYSLMSLGLSIAMFPAIFVLMTKGTFWRHEPAFVAVQGLYGIHPNVAKVQIEEGRVLNEEEAQTVVWAIREWEKRKRAGRRMGVSTFVALPVLVLGYVGMLWYGTPYGYYYYFVALYIYAPFLFAGAVWIITYLLLRRWDKNAMADVFTETTDYDEPIWMD
ncbi:MAG: hypothetical protein ACFFE7_02790 [Candidatus Thorarchaeota archaeon]